MNGQTIISDDKKVQWLLKNWNDQLLTLYGSGLQTQSQCPNWLSLKRYLGLPTGLTQNMAFKKETYEQLKLKIN